MQFIKLNTIKQETVTAAAKYIDGIFGQLNVLMNNAGINVKGDGPPRGANFSAVQ